MNTQQGTALQTLQDVQRFLELHKDKLGAVPASGARAALDQVIADLSAHVGDQAGGNLETRGATRRYRALRGVLLYEHMNPIAKIARAELPRTPAIEPLKMPPGNVSAQRLASLAQGMADTAVQYTDVFVGQGLPADFAQQLLTARDGMLESVTGRNQSLAKRRGATQALKQRLSRARRVVAVLDAMVTPALADEPALLASWKTIKRVRKTAGGGASVNVAAPVASTAPAAATAPAGA
jgi:hypothetical protein